jgi:CheY-like chemotaxis protein
MSEPGKHTQPGPRKILVVDDDPTIRDMMTDILENEGLVPELARDGHEALSKLQTEERYLVFLDLMMPHFSGKEVCAALATQPAVRQRHILIMMSALADMNETHRLDVDMVMPKPFMVDDVSKILETYLK